jgi:glycosyltransferase involved in cell wall biosynthesis
VSRNIGQRVGGGRAVYIPPFIDVHRFGGDERDPYGSERDFVVGTMGYPVYRKGIRHLLEAAPSVLSRHPEALFLLAIDLPAVPYLDKVRSEKEYLEGFIGREGLSGRVRILGSVDVPRYLKSLDLFVYAVQTTAGMIDIPPTVLECLAAGCGLLTTRRGAIGEVVKEGENGFFVPEGREGDPGAYADRIVELIEDRERLDRVRRNGPESVADFDAGRVIPRILDLYRDVLDKKGSACGA